VIESNREALTSNTRNLEHRAVKKAHISERNRDMGSKNGKTPTLSKLMNFGPHISTLLESTRAGLHDTKILWAKVQKRRRYGDGAKTGKPPLLKKVKFLFKKYV